MVTERSREDIWAILDRVPDPEIPSVSICDLGIVREVDVDRVPPLVTLTPTYSGCPATELIRDAIRDALKAAGIETVSFETRLSPPWTSEWLSERGKLGLRREGIAPPAESPALGTQQVIRFVSKPPSCPRCNAKTTTRLAEFGATACKALYRCEACGEPFEYFKPI